MVKRQTLFNGFNRGLLFSLLVLYALVLSGCAAQGARTNHTFTIAVIPDTQNAIDFKRQKAQGFAIDSSDIFIEEMRHIAGRGVANGGDVVFVASVGDVWQHPTANMDPAHFDRGVTAIDNPYFAASLTTHPEALTVEIPKAIEGYRLLAEAGIPFGVAPGNHDYDAIWAVASFPPNLQKPREEITRTVEDLGTLHIGGLANFRSAFGEDTAFFRDKSWYIDGFEGGGSSAQLFSAGGYSFLHFALEMQPGDHVFAWAEEIMARYPNVPTIVTTHEYLDRFGERTHAYYFEFALADPGFNNNPEQMWQKFIRKHDQIFLVLSGHNLGQALRIDDNDGGHKVYQIMADYQERGQAGIDAGQPLTSEGTSVGIGDGWFRELRFDLAAQNPTITVKTYSTHYKTYSGDLPTYGDWYKQQEQPEMSDQDFYRADDFVIELEDFHRRFKRTAAASR